MKQLSIAHYDMITKYVQLLDTIEEGFRYVLESFDSLERTEGEQVLADIFLALIQINQTNNDMNQALDGEESILTTINQFERVINEIAKLEEQVDNLSFKQEIIKENVYPVFMSWKENIQNQLSDYVN